MTERAAPNPVLTAAIDSLASREDLSAERAADVLAEVMAGQVPEVQVAALLIALRTKGETREELVGLATAMRRLATPVALPDPEELLDTAGTGGGRSTFNVSTTAALVAAAAGCRVAKHGNRSATGRSGSADLLEALGVAIDLAPEQVAACVRDVGFGFMFAPAHHGATRWVVPVRRALGVRTAFNLLGPLTNPAGAARQLVGVADPGSLERIAGALARLGARRALVVSSDDGLDEMSTSGTTQVVEVRDGALRRSVVAPGDVGLPTADPDAVRGGTPEANARVTRAVLAGEPGPARDLVVLNAGAAILAGGRADDLADGVGQAQAALDSGAAARTLAALVERTRALRDAPA